MNFNLFLLGMMFAIIGYIIGSELVLAIGGVIMIWALLIISPWRR